MQTSSRNLLQNIFLGTIAVGVIVICLQNFGILPTNNKVHVVGGYIGVAGHVDVSGSVSVDNTVDVNLKKISGKYAACRKSYAIEGKDYMSLDVSVR